MKFLKRLSVGSVLLLGSSSVWGNETPNLNVTYQNLTPYSATLNWHNADATEFQQYKVFCNGEFLFTTSETNCDFKSLVPNQNYTFKLQAVDADGNDLQNNSITLKTLAADGSNFFLLNSYAFDKHGAKVAYFDGVQAAMDQLFPTTTEYLSKYDNPQKWYNFYNIKARTPYKTEILNNINFNFYEDGEETILNSGKDKFLAMTFDGFLVVGEDGEYTFKTEHDNSFILEIDGKEIVNEMKFKDPQEYTEVSTNLLAGVHRVKITYYEFSGVKSNLLMQYSGPNFNFRPLDGYSFIQLADNVQPYLATDADFDGVADSLEEEKGASNQSWDTDNDGLTDYEEIVKFNSNPAKADSDNDGISDKLEAKITKTNPMLPDNNNNESLFSDINTKVVNDKLTLSWTFGGQSVSTYKIFRNFTEIGSTTNSTFALPVISENDIFYIVAINTDGTCSFKKVGPATLTNQQKEYLAWKAQKGLPAASMFDADFDNDTRSNYIEFKLDTNPKVAPLATAENLAKASGLIATYSDKMWAPESLQNLDNIKLEVVNDPSFDAGEGEVLNSGKTDGVHILYKGYFNAPTTGMYKFLTAYDDSVTIYIDGVKVFSGSDWNSVGVLWKKHLKAGMHSIKIEYYEGVARAMLDLKWAPPGLDMQPMAGDTFWHIEKKSAELDEYIAWDKDSDGDGLSNAYELAHGTDMNNADSDNDGINDYDEINKYKTDPNNTDSDGDGISDGDEINKLKSDPNVADVKIDSYIEIAKFTGAQYNLATGVWTKTATDSDAITSGCAIGTLNYKFNNEEAGVFKLNVKTSLRIKRKYKVDIYCDDVLVISENIKNVVEDTDYVFEGFMQHLKAGEHTVKVIFDNPNPINELTINEVEILQPIAGDSNEDNQDDWLTNYTDNMTKLANIPTTSKISPVIIEGENRFAETLKINNKAVTAFNGENWYQELTLSQASSANNFDFEFQNGLKTITKNIAWVPTNVITEDEVITVKKGSAMLLTAMPKAENVQFTNAKVNVDGVNYPVTNNAFKKVTFSEAKDYTIKGSYVNSNGETIEKTLTVKVTDYAFNTEKITMTTKSAASFTIPELPENMYVTTTGKVDSALSNNKDLLLDSREWNQDQAVVIRAKSDDKIIATLPINLIRYYGIGQTTFRIAETLADGTQVMELHSICYPMKSNYSIEYKLFLSGIAFEDGTVNRTLTSNDFSQNGTGIIKFVKTPTAPKTAACHHATFKIDGKKVQALY